MNQIIKSEFSALVNVGAIFGILTNTDTFVMLYDASYDETDGQLYYYDPRDDDIWTVERLINELHGTYSAWTDCVYFINKNENETQVLFKAYIHSKYNIRISVMEDRLTGKPNYNDLPD
jgi:hypothetical protein